jgi:hypothetical protein
VPSVVELPDSVTGSAPDDSVIASPTIAPSVARRTSIDRAADVLFSGVVTPSPTRTTMIVASHVGAASDHVPSTAHVRVSAPLSA